MTVLKVTAMYSSRLLINLNTTIYIYRIMTVLKVTAMYSSRLMTGLPSGA
jgi:hypothetical protein